MLETTKKQRAAMLYQYGKQGEDRGVVALCRDVDRLVGAVDRRAGAAHAFAVALGGKGAVVGHAGGFGSCKSPHCVEARELLQEAPAAPVHSCDPPCYQCLHPGGPASAKGGS